MADHPESIVDEIANEVLELACTRATLHEATIVKMLTVICTDGLMPNATLAGYGYEGDEDLFFSLLSTCKTVAGRIGLEIQIHKLNEG